MFESHGKEIVLLSTFIIMSIYFITYILHTTFYNSPIGLIKSVLISCLCNSLIYIITFSVAMLIIFGYDFVYIIYNVINL